MRPAPFAVALAALALVGSADGQEGPPQDTTEAAVRASYTLRGYAEVFYQWNFNQPSNGLTNFRGFDNRHNTFTLANAVVDAAVLAGSVSARVALQVGHTPETYYLAEPSSPGSAGAGSTGAQVWKFLQQANVGYRAPLGGGGGLLVEGGLFLSPIGPESMAIKDQWSWSRSNLFFGLPFYHTGVRLSYGLTDRLTASLQVYNGWNSVVDNNAEKSFAVQATYIVADKVTWNLLYFTGVERPPDAPEGRPWRHLLDSYLAWSPLSWLDLLVHADVGFESNNFGTSQWTAGALYLRFRPLSWLFLAGRTDLFDEDVAENADGQAAAIFWPASFVRSHTMTVDLRPHDTVSFRLEYRHDHAGDPMYFRGSVTRDAGGAFLPNTRSQNTLTAGMVSWF